MPDSAWFIGSIAIPALAPEFSGAPGAIAAGTYYLRHATASLSLLDQVVAAMTTAGVTAPAAVILENRRVRLSGSSSFDIDFIEGTLQLLLGFSTDTYGSATSHTAENVSPLLWSPGYFATPATPDGVDGYVVNDRAVLRSADMTRQQVDTFNEGTFNELSWDTILADRLRVDDASDGGGTFHELLEQSAKLGYHLFWYPSQAEDDASTTAVTWGTARGPYVVRLGDFADSWYARKSGFEFVDQYGTLDLPLMRVSEYA